VEHELIGKDGIIAWQLATNESNLPFMEKNKDLSFNSFNFETIIYVVRNPKDSLPSIVHTEKGSIPFRCKIMDSDINENRFSMSIKSILKWDELIVEKKPDFIFRIESNGKNLFEFLKQRYENIIWNDSEIGKVSNSRIHTNDIQYLDKGIDATLKEKLNDFCLRMRYDKCF
jgi:hypothetical protein